VVHVYVLEALQLGRPVAVHRIGGVTREAGGLARHPRVGVVRGRDVHHVVDVQALAVVLHDVARDAESGLLRFLDVLDEAHGGGKNGQDGNDNEAEQSTAGGGGQCRANDDQRQKENRGAEGEIEDGHDSLMGGSTSTCRCVESRSSSGG